MTDDRVAAAFDGMDLDELPDTVDRAAVERVRRVAYLLDESIPVPGTKQRIGIDPLLSVVPGNVGDVVSAAVSLYIVAESARLGVPFTTVVKMLGAVTLDTAAGMVPIVGPVFDAVLKTNKWTVEMLVEELLPEESQEGADETEPVSIDVSVPDDA